ncbi:MAG: hypothetical protein K1X74_04090 [Pirellulales bacterium]|nr:hypothetical protein [Pirellulales bacterium]
MHVAVRSGGRRGRKLGAGAHEFLDAGWQQRHNRKNERVSESGRSWPCSPGRAMAEFLSTPAAQLVLWITILSMLLAAGWYVVGRIRQAGYSSGPNTAETLADFRELHAKGELSDEEYRTIKSMLAARMHSKPKPDTPAVRSSGPPAPTQR